MARSRLEAQSGHGLYVTCFKHLKALTRHHTQMLLAPYVAMIFTALATAIVRDTAVALAHPLKVHAVRLEPTIPGEYLAAADFSTAPSCLTNYPTSSFCCRPPISSSRWFWKVSSTYLLRNIVRTVLKAINCTVWTVVLIYQRGSYLQSKGASVKAPIDLGFAMRILAFGLFVLLNLRCARLPFS
jgi:hypothetical protein